MPVIGEEAAIDKVANKRGTTRTGQIRQWIEERLEAAAEGKNTSRGCHCRIRLAACKARPSVREPA
jgi:hypothetical protein